MRVQLLGVYLIVLVAEICSEGGNGNSISNSSKNKGAAAESPHFHAIDDQDIDNQSDAATHSHDPNSVFDVLIKTFYVVDPSKDSSNETTETNGSDTSLSNSLDTKSEKQPNVPDIEIEKLKAAAKNAGLIQAKADRVARAATEMNMQYNDIVELRKMLNNPATSADYADKVRRALEDAVVEQALKKNAQPTINDENHGQNQHASVTDPSKSNQRKENVATTGNHQSATPPQSNPFDRDFQPSNIFPSSDQIFGNFPFPPMPPLFKAFALPPGLFGQTLEKSPLLDLWRTASPVIGSKEAYRLTLICQNLALTKEEILELQHLFSDSTMTKEKGIQLLSTYENRLSEAAKATLATPNVDPITLQNLKSMATISGLDEHSANRLVRAVIEAKLDSDHVMRVARAIQENAPSDNDLIKITDHLEADNKNKLEQNSSNGTGESIADGGYENEWASFEQPKGAEWIFASQKGNDDGERSERALNIDTGSSQINRGEPLRLFAARRFCGFSPKVEPTRLSNTAPGEFPWTASVHASDNRFLCGGTLISESIVLCTASCIQKYNQETKNQQPVKVIFSWSLPEGPENQFPTRTIYAASAVFHPSAESNAIASANGANNIALLRLTESVDFDLYPHIFPICSIGAAFEQHAGTNNCKVYFWQHLPNMEPWRPRSYLQSASVQVIRRTNCGGPGANVCITGPVCRANEGSPVICLANSQRYYLWGIINKENSCEVSSTTTTIPVTSVLDGYPFVSTYIFTSNPINQNSIRV